VSRSRAPEGGDSIVSQADSEDRRRRVNSPLRLQIAALLCASIWLATPALAAPLDPCVGQPDGDGDGACDIIDNCSSTPNATQLDGDLDGFGDVCDCDFSGSADLVCSIGDFSLFASKLGTLVPPTNSEFDMSPDGMVAIGDFSVFAGQMGGLPGPACGNAPGTACTASSYPTRLFWAPDGRLYVSDAQSGSVFVYERRPGLTQVGRYRKLLKPLGIALGPNGALYVGDDGKDRVEVYDPEGTIIRTIGDGSILMPNDLAFDATGDLYVVDSKSNEIQVYDPISGALLRTIGAGELRFPVALEISGQEIFVADQRNAQIKVFDLQGNLLRALGGFVGQGSLGYSWKGKFVHLQSVAIDSAGRLHALDTQQGLIEVLDATTGAFITSYGVKGTGPGQLSMPLDIDINDADETAVSDAGNRRVEILSVP
jgi:DNA-binding beta-propeller fold protein YncE